MSRRFIIQTSIALSLLFAASWLVTKTTATSKTNVPERATISFAATDSTLGHRTRLSLAALPGRHAFQQTATTEKPAEKTIEQAEKNIKVLNGIPQSQLIPMMNLMAASLGVRCNYCHVNNAGQWDFASDEKKEKGTAREMIAMTMNINKTQFKGRTEVACYTCHKGRSSPLSVPALPLPAPPPRPQGGPGGAARPGGAAGAPGAPATASATPATAQPTADDILSKYIVAVGGQAAIDKLKTRTLKGTYAAASGESAGFDVDQAAPDKFHMAISLPNGKMERVFDGAAGWEKGPRGVNDLGGQILADMKSVFTLFSNLKLKEQFTRMSVRKDKLNDRDVFMIAATRADGGRERLYFDAETGLLLRRSSSLQTPIGAVPQETNFEDYRDVDGVKVPFTVSVLTVDQGSTATIKYSEIKNNAPVDDSVFSRPPAPPPARPKP
jgi:outer membrane lipoprotein-sorting protein